MKFIIALLVIVPWSLIGMAYLAFRPYLAYRRVRGQQSSGTPFLPHPALDDPFPEMDSYEEAKEGWKVVDADHIAKIGRA